MARNSAATGGEVTLTTSRKHALLRRILRTLQFLSSFTSLILFSVRIAKIIRLTGRASHSNGAVEGILAAAVLYTLAAMLLQFCIRGTGSNLLRMLLIIFDVLFVGAFIAVAVLTSPKRHGSSAPCSKLQRHLGGGKTNCSLPWGTFILAIVSTLLHAITAAYHAAKDHRKGNYVAEKDFNHNRNDLEGADATTAQHGRHGVVV